MPATESNLMPLGTPAADFSLPDTRNDQKLSLSNVKGEQATVIMFICNHCPYVKHIKGGIARVAEDYKPKGVSTRILFSSLYCLCDMGLFHDTCILKNCPYRNNHHKGLLEQ